MSVSDQIGGFPPLDWILDLSPVLLGLVTLVISMGTVVVARLALDRKHFRLVDQWFSFLLGFPALAIAAAMFSSAMDLPRSLDASPWLGWAVIIVAVLVRQLITEHEFTRSVEPLTRLERFAPSKWVFDLVAFPTMAYVLTVTAVGAASNLDHSSAGNIAQMGVGLMFVAFWCYCIWADSEDPPRHPHDRSRQANTRIYAPSKP